MTSPSQLNYLDAMGIPVWVSRDLVIEKQPVIEEVVTVDDHVDTILHDLEEQQELVHTPQKLKTPEIPTTPVIANRTSVNAKPQANEIGQSSLHRVYGCGNLQAEWMIIGESPELNSDRQNQPYAGETGILLSNMLGALGIENPRETTYLVNVLKSSVPSNPELEKQSAAELQAILLQQIEKIKPKLLLVVGQIAAQRLLQSQEPLARLRGKEHRLPNSQIPLVVTYYPSYLLSKPLDKRKAWEDLKLAVRLFPTLSFE